MKKLFLITVAFICILNNISATDYYVSPAGNNTTGNGTSGSQWRTITYALIHVSGPGAIIHVAAGKYNTSVGEVFPIAMKNGVSLIGAGIDTSFIDAGSNNGVFQCDSIVDASTKIEKFTIENGQVSGYGGGFFISAGSLLQINNNKIINNTSNFSMDNDGGGAFYIENSSPKIIDNIISGNTSEDGGDAIYLSNSSALIKGNKIINNFNSSWSNCLYITGSTSNPRFINNVIAGNSGDAFNCNTSSFPEIINNTISDNTGNGIYIYYATPDSIINNIISYNLGYGINEYGSTSNHGIIGYNLFYVNAHGLFEDKTNVSYFTATDLNSVSECGNNIVGDPMFVNKAAGDYHLQCISPAIDKGDTSFEFKNEPLPNGNRIDIGAYGNTFEAHPKCIPSSLPIDIFVGPGGNNTTGNGTQVKPWKTISFALSQISSGRHIVHVASGTYNISSDEIFPIYLKDSVSLIGTGIDTSYIDAKGSASGIFQCIGITDDSAKIEKFTIENGQVSGCGGGFFISAGSFLQINNNKIINNTSNFSNNGDDGGAFYIENSSPKIIDNIISGNASEYDNGCAIYLSNSSALIKGNKIINNFNSSGTNCLYITSTSHPRIINNVIAGNSGDAFNCNTSSVPVIINNTISDNSGDGIKLEAANADSIINNIISFNSGYGIEESSESENPKFINYNLFYINANGLFKDKDAVIYSTATALNSVTGCKNNIDNDPMFVNKATGDYHLKCISPAIDKGDSLFAFSNEPLPNGNRIDIGAYGNTREATSKCEPTSLPVDLYVNSISGKDSSDYGTASNTPWKTITYALSQISNGRHTVHVASGTYNKKLGETFPINMKDSVTLQGAGSNESIIDAGGLNTVVTCIGISDTSTELASFKIEGGGTVSDGVGIFISAGSLLKVMNNNITDNNPSSFMSGGGGIYITNASPSILNNTINNNGAESYTEDGAGIYMNNSSPLIFGNIITGNGYSGFGSSGCLYTTALGNPRIVNNVIAKNYGTGIYCGSNASIVNNTITDNDNDGIYVSVNVDSIINNIISFNGGYGIEEYDANSDPVMVSYNLFYKDSLGDYYDEGNTKDSTAVLLNSISGYSNNIDGDPMFVNKIKGDYHLKQGSPAINTGDPNSPRDYDGSIADIGVFATPELVLPVINIIVTGLDGVETITTNNGTLQMIAKVQPSSADDTTVTWSVSNRLASINSTGLLTAIDNGDDTVIATANDGSGVYGQAVIHISGQTTNCTLVPDSKATIYQGGGPNVYYFATDTFAKGVTYQWYYNGKAIQGATKYYYVAYQNYGAYYVEIMQNGKACPSISKTDTLSDVSNKSKAAEVNEISLYPNPAKNELFVKIINGYKGEITFTISDLVGRMKYNTKFYKEETVLTTSISIIDLTKGYYMVDVKTNSKILEKYMFIKQ
jgi:hypothetical protein